MTYTGGEGTANDASARTEAAARLANKDQAAAEYEARRKADADENIAAAERKLDKAHASVEAAKAAVAEAKRQRKELD